MDSNKQPSLFDFESLDLYKKSLDYIDFVYKITQDFPREEKYGLAIQFTNAANSIALNIGEGYGESIRLALRYLRITRGSIRECLVNSTISFRNGFINERDYNESRKKLSELSRLSSGYKKYLIRNLNNDK